MKADLIVKEFRGNIQTVLNQRYEELVEKLKNTNQELSDMEIRTLLNSKNIIGNSYKFNTTELVILFEYYKNFILEINKVTPFLPTKKNFCSFIGISSNIYNNWRQSDDEERREIMQMIDDYITDIQLSAAQAGKVKEISTIFRSKAEHGMVEAQAPIVFEHRTEANINKIREQINAINNGRSLKDLDIVEVHDYETEDGGND